MKPPFTIAVLAEYIAAERFERLPKRVVTKAVHCIQDSVACLLGAYSTRLAGILTGFARERGGPLEAHVLGSRIRTSCTTAAFANALLINALDYDDIVLGHMGATAISAAFASGEKTNAAGKDLIAATVVGYEVSARIGRALLPTSPRKKTHGVGDLADLRCRCRFGLLAETGARSGRSRPGNRRSQCAGTFCHENRIRLMWSQHGQEQFRDSRGSGPDGGAAVRPGFRGSDGPV